MTKPNKLHIFTPFNPRTPWTSIKRTPCGLDKSKFGVVHSSEGGGFFRGGTLKDVPVRDICKNCLRCVGYLPMKRGR